MKVEHAFLPKGELVLLIRVQSEEDRLLLGTTLEWGHKRINPKPEFVEKIGNVLDASFELFSKEKK